MYLVAGASPENFILKALEFHFVSPGKERTFFQVNCWMQIYLPCEGFPKCHPKCDVCLPADVAGKQMFLKNKELTALGKKCCIGLEENRDSVGD